MELRNRLGKIVKCNECGNDLYAAPYKLKKNTNFFCKKDCQQKWETKYSTNSNCPICNDPVKTKSFRRKKTKGMICCSRKCRGEYLKTAYSGLNNPNSRHKDDIHRILTKRVDAIRGRSEKEKIPFDIDLEYLYEIYNKQQGQCFYTKIPLQFISKKWEENNQPDLDVLSVDKIIPSLGYVKGNIVLCCNGINKLKGSATVEDFYDFLHFVVAKNNESCKVNVKKLSETAKVPTRINIGDVGYDLFVDKWEELGDGTIKIYTGIAISPQIGWYFELVPRSSIYKKGMCLANSIGIIDNGYQGEICAIFLKTREYKEPIIGERLLQIIPHRYTIVEINEVDSFEESDRSSDGFGSTGA